MRDPRSNPEPGDLLLRCSERVQVLGVRLDQRFGAMVEFRAQVQDREREGEIPLDVWCRVMGGAVVYHRAEEVEAR